MSKRAHWQEQGQPPDYRFSLANERTFLAWIRTALALLAAGIVIHGFAGHATGYFWRIDIGLVAGAAVVAAFAYLRWKGNEIAMRHARPLPRARAHLAAAIVMAVFSCMAMALIVAHW